MLFLDGKPSGVRILGDILINIARTILNICDSRDK